MNVDLGRLLVIDFHSALGERHDALVFVYEGGVMSANDESSIRLPPSELASFKFVDVSEAEALIGPAKAARVRHALMAKRDGRLLELSGGPLDDSR